jgi:hypothetical protein
MAIEFLDVQSWYEYGREKNWYQKYFVIHMKGLH